LILIKLNIALFLLVYIWPSFLVQSDSVMRFDQWDPTVQPVTQ
jgi:hypothetical protein